MAVTCCLLLFLIYLKRGYKYLFSKKRKPPRPFCWDMRRTRTFRIDCLGNVQGTYGNGIKVDYAGCARGLRALASPYIGANLVERLLQPPACYRLDNFEAERLAVQFLLELRQKLFHILAYYMVGFGA